jgi:hypothetical protein
MERLEPLMVNDFIVIENCFFSMIAGLAFSFAMIRIS